MYTFLPLVGTSARRVAQLCGLVLWLGGCHAVLGDYAIETKDKTLSATSEIACTTGELVCRQEFLLQCDSSRKWALVDTCATQAQCDALSGQCRVCDHGSLRCNGAAREACTADQAHWARIEECDSQEECSAGACGDCKNLGFVECAGGGEEAAQSTVLRRCGEDGRWEVLDDCASAQLCALSAAAAMSDPENFEGECTAGCEPGLRCEGRDLQRCPTSRAGFETIDSCQSEALCAQTLEQIQSEESAGAGSTCLVGCPIAGQYSCEGQDLLECRADQTKTEVVETCAEDETCDSVLGRCSPPCAPGAYRCNAARLEVCNDNGRWDLEQECASSPLCVAQLDQESGDWIKECKSPPDGCEKPDLFSCDGAELGQCLSDQTDVLVRDTCASATLCDATSGTCVEPQCSPADALRCDVASPLQLLRCNPETRQWLPEGPPCGEGQTCNADPAAGPVCLEDCPVPPERCSGSLRQDCSDDSGSPEWTGIANACASQALCECGISGTCAGGVNAADGVCGNPICGLSLADFRCDGSMRQACSSGRAAWDSVEDCGSADLCFVSDDGNSSACLACPAAGEARCFAEEDGVEALLTCAPDRLAWLNRRNCTSNLSTASGTPASEIPGTHCIEVENGNDYCAVCAAGETRCSGTGPGSILRQCNAAQDGLSDVRNCENGCVNSGLNDFCSDCARGTEKRCNAAGTGVVTCDADGGWPADSTATACGSATPVCVGGECKQCQPGTTRCQSGQLQTCGASGTWASGTSTSCSYGCFDAPDGQTDYCKDCNDTTQTQCDSGLSAVQTCNTTTGRFSSAMTCADGCFDVTNSYTDYCRDCASTETRCAGASSAVYQICSASGLWTDGMCAASCSGMEPNATCGVCTNGTTQCANDATTSVGQLKTCTSGMLPATGTPCTGGNSCAGNACGTCLNGTTLSCSDNASGVGQRVTCSNGTSSSASACPNNASCSGVQSCGSCQNGATGCNAAGNPQECQSGAWVEIETCADGETCDPATGCLPSEE